MKHTNKRAQTRVYVALISSQVPGGAVSAQILTRLALKSFLGSIGQKAPKDSQSHSPHKGIVYDLGVYMPCSSVVKQRVSSFRESDVETSLHEYTRGVVSVVDTFKQGFENIKFYCAGLLPVAFCHFKHAKLDYDYYFLLEHDWLMLPTRLNATVHDILKAMEISGVDYALLQRGTRPFTELLTLNPVILSVTPYYSNNPFLATATFMKRIGSESSLCRNPKLMKDRLWERAVESFATKNHMNIAIVGASLDPQIYHMDGQFFKFARQERIGPIFGLSEAGEWLNGSVSDDVMLSAIETTCLVNPGCCAPYYFRDIFATKLVSFARSKGLRGIHIFELTQMYMGHADVSAYFTGHFPGRPLVETELKS